MPLTTSTWRDALLLSVATLLSFLARALIDYGFVYRELYRGTRPIGILTLVYLAFIAGWIWALLAASHNTRRAMYVLLVYGAIVALHAGVTQVAFCPFPCRTAWPLGQVVIWLNLLLGVPAVVVSALSLRRTPT
jgi:hypothetical protein